MKIPLRPCSLVASLLSMAIAGAVSGADTESSPTSAPPLKYAVSWVGNTFAEANKWVQMDAAGMFVARDGTVYLNIYWEEGGRNVGIYRNGQCIGNAGHTHGWGYEGGEAVAANGKYLFIAQHVKNEGGGLKSPKSWPPKGKSWAGVSRRFLDGKPAPFDGGKGGDGDTLACCFLPVDEHDEKAAAAIAGLATTDDKLYVSDSAGRVSLFDPATMTKTAEFNAPRAGPIALAPDGSLWLIQRGQGAESAKIVHYSAKGELLPQTIERAAVPTALACSDKGQLYIADDGPDQQVKIFDAANCRQVGVLGDKGGICSDVKGQVRPLKFNGLTGVGLDGAGNVYVACRGRVNRFDNGSGLALQSYSPAGPLHWELLGLEFVDNADVDPDDDTNVYTKSQHFAMNYAKGAGQEWSYKGYTLDRFAYPNDPRLHVDIASTFARRIGGKLFLFGIDMYSERLVIYRTTEKDEIAVPCGCFAQKHLKGEWPPNQPSQGQWIWIDKNADGDFDADEFDSLPKDNPSAWGWWVDGKGDIWQASDANVVRRFPCQSLSAGGVPIYSFATVQTESAPAPFTHLQRIEYFPETDTMYLSGYSKEFANRHGNWKTTGKVICRYDDWSTKKTLRWELHPPFDEAQDRSKTFGTPVAMSVAGEYLFVAYLKTAEVRIYEAATAKYVGTLWPGKDMSGWLDIPYAVRAHRRASGEYLVFVEEDAKAKIIMYRWKP